MGWCVGYDCWRCVMLWPVASGQWALIRTQRVWPGNRALLAEEGLRGCEMPRISLATETW